jgi:peptide/nickel transport system substrate-binding protein
MLVFMRRRSLGVVVGITMVLAACGETSTSTAPSTSESAASSAPSASQAEDRDGGTLVYASGFDPLTLDPSQNEGAFVLVALRQLYDGLVVRDPSGEVHPHLATGWEVADDGVTWTFELESGVTFHDGTPFNAEAVKFTLDRVMAEETASPAANRFNTAIESVNVIDDDTLEIVTNAPNAPFLTLLASSWAYIVSPAAVDQFGADFGSNPVGTGAFRFVSWVKTDRITLERNAEYAWAPPFLENQGPPHVDELILRQISDPTALTGSMENGESQLLGFMGIPNAQRLADLGNSFQTLETPSAGWLYYMNTEKFPTDDLLVRQAIAHAIDAESASATPLWQGQGVPIRGPLNPNHPFASTEVADALGYDYDPERAIELLEEAGWQLGDDGIRVKDGERLVLVDVTTSETAVYGGSAEIVQQQLREVGIEVQIQSESGATFSAAQARGEHNIAIRTNVGDDPSSIFGSMLACDSIGVSGQNLSRYCSDEVESLLDDGVTEFDQDARFAIYERLQEIVLEQALARPFQSRTFTAVIGQEIDGFTTDFVTIWFGSQLYFK